MARARQAYPQVEPGSLAGASPVAVAPSPAIRVGPALALCRRRGAAALLVGSRRVVRREDLERALAWGLGRLPAGRLAHRGVPVVPARASEVAVRRHLAAGAPMVVVGAANQPVGVVRAPAEFAWPAHRVTRELERLALDGRDAEIWLLRLCGKVAEGMGLRVYAVGGWVRDLLLGRRATELDVAVEGDGPAFARQLSEELGARLTVHEAFGTASLLDGHGPDGARTARVDVVSARRDRYAKPGALPAVTRAGIVEDLLRRDFSAHALAVSLSPDGFGQLLDPSGGRADLRGRWLRPLSPVSFLEDPTRVFRAARYATRLDFRLHRDGHAALDLALAVGRYPALSGDRLRAELALIVGEADPWRTLGWLARHGALRLWDPRYRPDPDLTRRLGAARRLTSRARATGVNLDALTLALVATLAGQRRAVIRACLDRLGVAGQAGRALADMGRGPMLARWLAVERPPSRIVRHLSGLAEAALISAWLGAGPPVRRRILWYWTMGRRVRPRLTGRDLIALGVPEGPAVGRLLSALRDHTLDDLVADEAAERAVVTRWLDRKGGRA
jgi:tRNA nucleotidyltransferase (CCA-adding enzyme)